MTTHKLTAAEIEQAGREIRLKRERLRAAIDRKPGDATPEGGWVFANENGTVTALALGPCVRVRYKL
jgi:hypothetical protein